MLDLSYGQFTAAPAISDESGKSESCGPLTSSNFRIQIFSARKFEELRDDAKMKSGHVLPLV